MFTTLPLELFVCREVRSLPSVTMRHNSSPLQVIENYFFSHEAFNQQRHIFFTTTILFASLLSNLFLPWMSVIGSSDL